jgi:hypothetical protein
MIRKCLFITTVFLCFSFSGSNWKVVNSEDDIYVYNRDVPESSMPQSKVETLHKNGTLKKFKDVLLDFGSYKNWIPRCSTSEVIENKESRLIYYAIYAAPWPVSDRDVCIEVTFVETDDKFVMTSKALENFKPKKDNNVRIPLMISEWIVEQKGDDVSITNTSLSKPGGNIPDWLTSDATTNLPLKLMQNLIEIAGK